MTTATTPTTLRSVQEALSRPFPMDSIEIKPGALIKDRTRGLALAFGDPRQYMARLDEVIGPDDWSVAYDILPQGVLCRLTILGHTRQDVGDYPTDSGDPNRVTSAAMQALKRACASYGLGRYLYHLPQIWADYDEAKRAFKDPRGVIHQVYTLAGLTSDGLPRAGGAPVTNGTTHPADGATTETTGPAGKSERIARAKAALAAVEEHSRTPKSNGERPATERQLAVLRDRAMLETVRERFGVERLEDLGFSQASTLISEPPARATR
jgi:hypothetical protein